MDRRATRACKGEGHGWPESQCESILGDAAKRRRVADPRIALRRSEPITVGVPDPEFRADPGVPLNGNFRGNQGHRSRPDSIRSLLRSTSWRVTSGLDSVLQQAVTSSLIKYRDVGTKALHILHSRHRLPAQVIVQHSHFAEVRLAETHRPQKRHASHSSMPFATSDTLDLNSSLNHVSAKSRSSGVTPFRKYTEKPSSHSR